MTLKNNDPLFLYVVQTQGVPSPHERAVGLLILPEISVIHSDSSTSLLTPRSLVWKSQKQKG